MIYDAIRRCFDGADNAPVNYSGGLSGTCFWMFVCLLKKFTGCLKEV
jgi:hypothetical protein